MDAAKLLKPWNLNVTTLTFWLTLIFNTALAFYHSDSQPRFTKIRHQGKAYC